MRGTRIWRQKIFRKKIDFFSTEIDPRSAPPLRTFHTGYSDEISAQIQYLNKSQHLKKYENMKEHLRPLMFSSTKNAIRDSYVFIKCFYFTILDNIVAPYLTRKFFSNIKNW